MPFDIHTFTVIFLGLLGAGLWRFYYLINASIEEKFKALDIKFENIEKNFTRVEKSIDEVKVEVKEIKQKMSEMDKQIAVLVHVQHIYVENPGQRKRVDVSDQKQIS